MKTNLRPKQLLGIITAFCMISASQANDQLSPNINNQTPAFATLIIKNDKVVFKGVQGCAVLKDSTCKLAANLDTPFSICSITKQFTAAGILMLEEDGKLSTDDLVIKYLPDLPKPFKGIRIRHLLFHISGIPDYIASDPQALDIDKLIEEGKKIDENTAYAFIKSSKLDPYSKKFAYSNSGYVVLTKIIEKVSNQTYSQFIQTRFFDRLAMQDAFVMADINKHGNYTLAYNPWPLYTPTNWMKVFTPSGEGGIFMSINDFEKWIYAFDHNQIFRNKATMRKYLSIGKMDNGKNVIVFGNETYGYGLMHAEVVRDGKKFNMLEHNGGMPGTASLISKVYNSDENIWVVYLNNAGSYPDMFSILKQAKVEY